MDAFSEGEIAGSVAELVAIKALVWIWFGVRIRILLDLPSYFLLLLSRCLFFIEFVGARCGIICYRFKLF